MNEVLNLNDTITDYLQSPEYKKLEAGYPKIKITTNLDNDLLNIKGSPIHLSKTIMNLVANAAEAIPQNGSIKLSTTNHYVDKLDKDFDKNLKEGNYAVLSVSDNGIGMDPECLNKIFEPFYTKKVMGQSGTGLGMTVVGWTMHDHNGHIKVKSKEGKGTTFKLYFPATRRKISVRKETSSTLKIEKIKGNGEKILVVDDKEEQRELISMMLSKLGYSVDAVISGEKAIDYIKTNRVDLLMLDMIMEPGIDGLDTYKEILKQQPGTKAIIVSGFTETERVREAQQLGTGVYVKKPYTLSEMGEAVRNELDK